MKKLIFLMGMFLFMFAGLSQAQSQDKAAQKAAKKAEKAAKKAAEEAQQQALFQQALQSMQDQGFVLEADRVIFKRGRSVFVSSNTNFISLDGDNAVVQVAFNGPYSGPNGLGGITVEGKASNIKMSTTKRRVTIFSMNVQGIGISASVTIQMPEGTNQASVTINPNFSGNTLTLSGYVLPIEQSSVFKGRSF